MYCMTSPSSYYTVITATPPLRMPTMRRILLLFISYASLFATKKGDCSRNLPMISTVRLGMDAQYMG